MTPVFIYAILYTISVRKPIPCGDNVHGSANVTWSCYQTDEQSHFVEIDDTDKALRFVGNLKPYNHTDVQNKDVPDNKRFIWGLTVEAFTKIDDRWTLINTHKVGIDDDAGSPE